MDLISDADHEANQDALTTDAVYVTARQGVIECAALLRALGHRESAEKLMRYHQNVVHRTRIKATLAIAEAA